VETDTRMRGKGSEGGAEREGGERERETEKARELLTWITMSCPGKSGIVTGTLVVPTPFTGGDEPRGFALKSDCDSPDAE